MLHGAPSGRATSKVSSSFAPYSKLFLHDPMGKRKEHACAVHGLVHDGVPTRRNKNSFWYRASDLSPIRVRPRPSVTRRQKDSRVGRATNARSPPSCFPAHPTGRCFIGACRGDCQIAPGSSCPIKTTDRVADHSGRILPVRSGRCTRNARADGHLGRMCEDKARAVDLRSAALDICAKRALNSPFRPCRHLASVDARLPSLAAQPPSLPL